MVMVTAINPSYYGLKQVPEVGKEYHIFDDGKIKPSRHYTAKIQKLLYPDEAYKITAFYTRLGKNK